MPQASPQAARRGRQTVDIKSLAGSGAFIAQLAPTLAGGDVLALVGPLGAGKTTVVQALARALGVRQRPRSPSYTLLQPYPLPRPVRGIKTLVHVDAYRVSAAELLDAGLADYLHDPQALVAIEWADRVASALPPHAIWLTIGFGPSATGRTFQLRRRTR